MVSGCYFCYIYAVTVAQLHNNLPFNPPLFQQAWLTPLNNVPQMQINVIVSTTAGF